MEAVRKIETPGEGNVEASDDGNEEFKPNHWALPLMILLGVVIGCVAGILAIQGVFEAMWGH